MPDSDEIPSDSEEEEQAPRAQAKPKSQKRKQKQPRRSRNEDSDDDTDVPKTSKKAVKEPPMSDADLERKAADLVRFAFSNEWTRRPITRATLVKEVIPGQAKSFNAVLANANRMAKMHLGMELVEVRQRATGIGHGPVKAQDKGAQHAFVGGKAYILRSLFAHELVAACADVDDWGVNEPTGGKSLIDWDKSDQLPSVGVLYLVLALILVNGRALPDNELRARLKKIGLIGDTTIPLNPSTAPSLGSTMTSLEMLLNTFVKQSYIEKAPNHLFTVLPGQEQQKGQRKRTAAQQKELDSLGAQLGSGAGGDQSIEWRWGPRADCEVGEKNVADFIYEFFAEKDATAQRQKEQTRMFARDVERAAGSKLALAMRQDV